MVVDTLQREDSFETESNFDEFESKHLFQSISRSVKNKITNSRFFALQVKLQFLNFRRQRGSAVSRLTQAVARFRAGAGSGSHSYGLRNVFSDDLQSANLHILHIRASRSPPLTQTYAKETFQVLKSLPLCPEKLYFLWFETVKLIRAIKVSTGWPVAQNLSVKSEMMPVGSEVFLGPFLASFGVQQ